MAGISVGSVSVRVVPDAQRFTRDLEAQIGGVARKFGQQLGKDLGEQVGKPIAEQVQQSMSKVAADVGKSVGGRMGKDMGDGIAKGMADGAKKGAKEVGGSGKDAGGAFSREFKKAVDKAMSDLPSGKRLGIGVDADVRAIDNVKRRLAGLGNKSVGVNIAAGDAITELKAIEAELNRIARKQTSARVDIRTDLETAQNDLARFRQKAQAEGDAAGQSYGGSFERKVREAISRAVQSLPEVKLGADSSDLDRAVANARTKLTSLSDKRVSINGDSSDFLRQFQVVQSLLNQLRTGNATASIRADAGEALREMGQVEAFLRRIDGQTATANVNVDDNGSSYVVDTNVSRLLNRLMLFGSAATGIAALVGPLLAVAGAAGVAAAALGAGILAFGGIGDAVKALNEEQTKSGEEAQKAAKKAVTSANAIASAQDRLGQAQRNVGVVQANVNDQAVSAANRVRDAEQRVGQVRAQAAAKAQQAAEAVASAGRRVESARRDAADRQLADLRNIRRAEDALQDAQRSSTAAQKALTAARKEATRQLEDMESSVVDNALAQRGAALDLIEARQELAKTNADPGAGYIERARAQLAYDEAIQRTKELSRDGRRLGADYSEAAAKGVEGSEAVTNAQQSVADATRGVRSAQESLGDAQRDYAKNRISDNESIQDAVRNLAKAQRDQAQTTIDNANSIRDAEEQRADAYRQQASQQRQGAEQIRNAQQQVVEAQRALQNAYTQSGDSGVSAADKVKEAFKDLSPTAAAFARFLFELKDEWLGLRAAAADGFLPGAQAGIEALLTRYNDFKIVIGQLASAGGEFVRQLGLQMASPYFTDFWRMIGDMSGPVMSGLADSLGRAAKSTAEWVRELLPLSGIGFDALNNLSDFFDNFAPNLQGISIPLTFAFGDILDDLEPLGPALVAAANAFAYLGRILGSLIGAGLSALTPVLTAVAGALAIIASVLDGMPDQLLAVLVGLLALRIAKTIFGDFRSAIDFTRKAYPAFGRDTRLAGETQKGLADDFGLAGNRARAAGNSFRAGGTDAAASQRQHLLLRTAVRDVGGMFEFAATTVEKARAAYGRGQRDAERFQRAADASGRTISTAFTGSTRAFKSFTQSADDLAVRTGNRFRNMAADITESLRNVRADAARGVSLGRMDNEVAAPGATLDMNNYAGQESLVTRLARTYTRLTTASDEFASSSARSFTRFRNVVTDTVSATTAALSGGLRGIGRGFDTLQLGAARAEGALVRIRDVFQSQGFKAAGTETARTFAVARDGVVSAARQFVAGAGSMARTFVATKDGIVQDASTIGGALVRMSDHTDSLGSRMGRAFAGLTDRQFPGLRREAVAFGQDVQRVLAGFSEKFRDTSNVFVAGAEGIRRGFQATGEKGLRPFEADTSRIFSAVTRAYEGTRQFVAGLNGVTSVSNEASSSLVKVQRDTAATVAPFRSASDRAYELGSILGTVGQTMRVSSERIRTSLDDVGDGTSRAGRFFTAFRDTVQEFSTSTAVAVRRTAAVMRSDVPLSAEEAERRTRSAFARFAETFRLTEARAIASSGNIGGALATIGSGAAEAGLVRIRQAIGQTATEAETGGQRIRNAFAATGVRAALGQATTEFGLAATNIGGSLARIPQAAGSAANLAIGHMGRFVGFVSGSLRAATVVGVESVRGLYQAIGGGAGVAIAAAGAAFAILLANYQRAERNATEARQAAVKYADELRKSNGVITQNIRTQYDQALATDGVTQAAGRLGYSQEQLRAAVENGGPAFDQLKQRLTDNGLGSFELGKQWSSLMYIIGLGEDPTIAAADNLQKVRDSIQGARDLAAQLPSELNKVQDALKGQGGTAIETVQSNVRWTDAVKNLGDESKTADDKVNGLSNALLGMSDPQAKAREAARDTAAAFRDLPAQFDAARGAFDRQTGAIDVNSEAGSNLSRTLDDLRKAYGTTYGAEFQKAIASGKDFQQASKIAADATSHIRDKLYEMAQAAGVPREAVDKLIAEFGLLPSNIPISMQLDTNNVFEELRGLGDRLKDLARGATIEIAAPTEDASRALQNLGFEVRRLPNGNVSVVARTDTARADMQALIAFGNTLRTDPTIAANPALFDATLLQKMNEARAAVGLPMISARDTDFNNILRFTLEHAGTLFGIPTIGGDPNRPGGFNPVLAAALEEARKQKVEIGIFGKDELTAPLRNLVDNWNGVTVDLKVRPNAPGQPIDPAKPPPIIIPGLRALGSLDRIAAMASGGFRTASAGIANVVAPNTPTLIGDRKKDDEAYIPLNNSPRSIAILKSAAAAMGFAVQPMAAGGLSGSAVQPMAGGGLSGAASTVDSASQLAAASATDTLAAALSGQASALGALNPALASVSAVTGMTQTAVAGLASANSALLVPSLQNVVNGGVTPLVGSMQSTLFPTLGQYQVQVGTNSVLANQALRLSQQLTGAQTDALALTTANDALAMQNATGSMSLYSQQMLSSLRDGYMQTGAQSTATTIGIGADYGNMNAAAFTSTQYQGAALAGLRAAMMVTGDTSRAWADGNAVQMGRISADTGGMVKWTYAFPLTSLVNAWNKLNTDFAINKPIGGLPALAFATGGFVPGNGRPTADDVPAMLSSGEFVVREAVARNHRPFLRALNMGQPEAVQAAGGRRAKMRGYAGGGDVERIARGKAFAAAQMGKPYVWAGVGPNGYDCSGFMSAIINFMEGDANPYKRIGATGSFPWPGFRPGLDSAFAIGSSRNTGNGIGHMAGTLGGQNVESAGGRGPAIGGPAIGADNPLFNIRASYPIGGTFVSGGMGGGPAGVFDIGAMIAPYFEEARKQADDLTTFFPTASALPAQAEARQGIDGAIAKASKDFMSSMMVGGAGGAEQWRPVVMRALALTGMPGNLADIVLQQIQIESGGNPRSINNWDVNARRGTPSGGLLQTIAPTFAANRDPRLANDMFDPLANIVAAIRYANGRYGSIANIWPKRNGYDSGGIASGVGLLAKHTQKPERVLSPQQTRSFDTLVGAIAEKDLLKAMAAPTSGGDRTINVYPRENQSEMSIATAVRRIDGFESRLR